MKTDAVPTPRLLRRKQIAVAALAASFALLVLKLAAADRSEPALGTSASSASSEAGLRAFADVLSVMHSPRCLNCHPAGDVPRQTGLRRAHFPPVNRGIDGHGVVGMRCSTCHQPENQSNGIPGAPEWGLAPRSMAWEGLSDHDLAELLKDPERNGHRTPEQLVEHLSSGLIEWAWQPGGSRTPPPISHAEFVQRFKDWIAAGAPSPEPSKN